MAVLSLLMKHVGQISESDTPLGFLYKYISQTQTLSCIHHNHWYKLSLSANIVSILRIIFLLFFSQAKSLRPKNQTPSEVSLKDT